MYRIIKDGVSVGMTETPNYIRQQENGCYALCPEPLAAGIAFEGAVYHLSGRDGLEGVETVILQKTDAGTEIKKARDTGGIMFVTMAESGSIDDVTAVEHTELFAPWSFPIDYQKRQLRQYRGALYKCVQDHTSQADWTPDVTPSLWTKVADPAEEWPKWAQPIGAHDAYNVGDQVSHNEKHWISNADGNVWEPGVYGWKEVTQDNA